MQKVIEYLLKLSSIRQDIYQNICICLNVDTEHMDNLYSLAYWLEQEESLEASQALTIVNKIINCFNANTLPILQNCRSLKDMLDFSRGQETMVLADSVRNNSIIQTSSAKRIASYVDNVFTAIEKRVSGGVASGLPVSLTINNPTDVEMLKDSIISENSSMFSQEKLNKILSVLNEVAVSEDVQNHEGNILLTLERG